MNLDIDAELLICEAAQKRDKDICPEGWQPLEATPCEDGHEAGVWYEDGDACAIVYDNIAYGACGNAYAELFAHAANNYHEALTRLKRIGELAYEAIEVGDGFYELNSESFAEILRLTGRQP